MEIRSISHTFYDFEIELVPVVEGEEQIRLVKILAVDGRRFTYEVRSVLTDDAVAYIKSLIDAVVFSDMIIEKTAEGFEVREASKRLKKHS